MWSARTRAILAGRPAAADGQPANTPLVPASAMGLDYSREVGTPTWAAFETAVGSLEGGIATAFASGMATVTAVLDLLPAGATVAVPVYSYAGTRGALDHAHNQGKITVRRIEPTDTDAWIAAAADADLLWLETPTNPTLDVMDLDAILSAADTAAKTTDRRPLTVVDNTFATPLGQQPLAHGADVVVHSVTKFIGGHSDLLLGVTVTAPHRGDLAQALVDARTRTGATPGTLESWLALRGLRTLGVRLAEASSTAAFLVDKLSGHPAVTHVRYPGSGAMVAFDLADGDAAERVCAALELVHNATSLGGVETTIERRAHLPGDAHVPAGLLRLSVGLEDPADLWRDLESALAGETAQTS
ncbi:cystathionine gamma-synthase [Saccharomonospora sp. CUA-673]|uniref:trans-sulfuration enzyme family protein n=1 Tax=Saccharomonospora sp. CUA-673 TaxID=1904969 RepID=UPI0009630477|nr:PLP-dependent aspartate aminotransferase family protein [Saccharomonospora sp. CUA-673]OLT40710.1 cystathionine gamma-synthase [Saccharomonospora sp. CUA-673]